MAKINSYVNLGGTTEEAFNFYKSVFGGEFSTVMRFKDVPSGGPKPKDENDLNKLMHIALPIGNGTVLMGSDRPAEWGQVNFGDNYSISISTADREEATRIFNGLSAEGRVTMPLADTFWGAYFGMFVDKFGVQWMLDCESN